MRIDYDFKGEVVRMVFSSAAANGATKGKFSPRRRAATGENH
jgi:hypothetical protein